MVWSEPSFVSEQGKDGTQPGGKGQKTSFLCRKEFCDDLTKKVEEEERAAP